jgi:hypothetical protein
MSELLEIRVIGAPEVAEQAAARLGKVLELDRVSGPRLSRKSPGLVLYYLTGRLTPIDAGELGQAPAASSTAPGPTATLADRILFEADAVWTGRASLTAEEIRQRHNQLDVQLQAEQAIRQGLRLDRRAA